MTKYAEAPAYTLIQYLWNELLAEGVLVETDYKVTEFDNLQLVPIVPIQEVPELANHLGDNPYMCYDIMAYPQRGDAWWLTTQHLLLTIYSQNFSKMGEIMELIQDKFRRMDDSAVAINRAGLSDKFVFKYTEVVGVEASGPSGDEDGRQWSRMTIEFQYARDIDGDGNFT